MIPDIEDHPDKLWVRRWRPIQDAVHRPGDPYILACWTSVLGPSSTLLYRQLGQVLEHAESGIIFSRAELAGSLGLGLNPNGPFYRALDRLALFNAARWNSSVYEVRPKLPDLYPEMLRRAPSSVQRFHELSVQARQRAASPTPGPPAPGLDQPVRPMTPPGQHLSATQPRQQRPGGPRSAPAAHGPTLRAPTL
jgi:hypothetical protein